jgi:mycothiol synthase
MAGCGLLACRTSAEPVHEMRYHGGVHPAYRGQGLGGRLLDWAETAALPLHQERYPGRPLSLSGSCLSHNAAAVALYAAHGYRPGRAEPRHRLCPHAAGAHRGPGRGIRLRVPGS